MAKAAPNMFQNAPAQKRERELKLAREGAVLQSIPLLANAWTLHSTSVASRLLSNKKITSIFKDERI